MSENNLGQWYTKHLTIPNFTAVLFALSATIAFSYELGFSWSLDTQMRSIIDPSDFVRTAIFFMPSFAIPMAIAFYYLICDGFIDGKFREAKAMETFQGSSTSYFRTKFYEHFFLIICLVDALLFVLFGGAAFSRPFFVATTVYLSAKLALSLSNRHLPGFFSYFAIYFLIAALCLSFWKGAFDGYRVIRSNFDELPLIEVENTPIEWRLLRRRTNVLVGFDGEETFSVISHSGQLLISWSRHREYWRGILCESPPDSAFGHWSRTGCLLGS